MIQDEFGWAKASFLPDDPLDLLVWRAGWFSGRPGLLFVRIGKHLNVKRFPDLVANMTLGELVDAICEELPRPSAA